MKDDSDWAPMAYSHWAECEIEYVRENFHKQSYVELGEALGRSASGVNKFCTEILGLKRFEFWSEAEDQLIKTGLPNREIMRITGRSRPAIKERRRRLAREGTARLLRYPAGDVSEIVRLIDVESLTRQQVAARLGLTYNTVIGRYWRAKRDMRDSSCAGAETQELGQV